MTRSGLARAGGDADQRGFRRDLLLGTSNAEHVRHARDPRRGSGAAPRASRPVVSSRGQSPSGFRDNAFEGALRSVAAGIVLLLAMGSTCSGAGPSPASPLAPSAKGSAQPFEFVRTLESLQDQIALGNGEARAKLPSLMGQIAAVIRAAEPEAWNDPRNLRAVIVYAASGGHSRAIRAVAELRVARGEMKDLLEGILAYVEGREARAKQILLPVEAMTLPVPLAGHVALVQANLLAKEDPREAMRLLARARVLAPGTLIEEAALRKEIFLADQAGDLESFANLSKQYLRRFDRSAYAENFRQRFKAAVVRFGLTSDPARFAMLETALAALEPDEELRLLLATARSGLVAGAIEPARHAVGKATAMARDGTAEASRAILYAAAMRVLTGEIDAGLSDLRSLDTTALAKPDTELAQAVRTIASDIRAEPTQEQPSGAAPNPADEALPAGPERQASESAATMIQRAESALREAGTLLERKRL